MLVLRSCLQIELEAQLSATLQARNALQSQMDVLREDSQAQLTALVRLSWLSLPTRR
jgi:hypothetical protein